MINKTEEFVSENKIYFIFKHYFNRTEPIWSTRNYSVSGIAGSKKWERHFKKGPSHCPRCAATLNPPVYEHKATTKGKWAFCFWNYIHIMLYSRRCRYAVSIVAASYYSMHNNITFITDTASAARFIKTKLRLYTALLYVLSSGLLVFWTLFILLN